MKKPHPNAQLVYPVTWNGEICGEPYWQWFGNTADIVVDVAFSHSTSGVKLQTLTKK